MQDREALCATLQPAAQGTSKQQHPRKGAVNHKMHHHLQREKFSSMPVIRVDLEGGFSCTEISFLFVLQFGIVCEDSPLCREVLEEMALKVLWGGSNMMVTP